jgi:hypothetical protein
MLQSFLETKASLPVMQGAMLEHNILAFAVLGG